MTEMSVIRSLPLAGVAGDGSRDSHPGHLALGSAPFPGERWQKEQSLHLGRFRQVNGFGISLMNDRDFWPIHVIFFGFVIALIISAIKSMVEEIFSSPLLLVSVVVVLLAIWLFRKRT